MEPGKGEGMRAQGGGGGRARGREERKEVTWVWMGRNGLGKRGLGFVSRLEVPSVVVGFLSHGNWNRKGMAATVAGGGRWESRRGEERQGGLHAHGEEDERKRFLGEFSFMGFLQANVLGPFPFLNSQKKGRIEPREPEQASMTNIISPNCFSDHGPMGRPTYVADIKMCSREN